MLARFKCIYTAIFVHICTFNNFRNSRIQKLGIYLRAYVVVVVVVVVVIVVVVIVIFVQ